MAFFRNTPEVLDKFHSYEKFSSFAKYFLLPPTRLDSEESEFSHYIFSDNDSFTFICVEGMVNSWDMVLISAGGTFYAPFVKKSDMTPSIRQRFARLVRPTNRLPVFPTFTSTGIEKKTKVFVDGRYYDGDMWFPNEYVTFVETEWNHTEREQKAYFMRREASKPITQRIEWRDRYLVRDGELYIDEGLYKHFQLEKHHRKYLCRV